MSQRTETISTCDLCGSEHRTPSGNPSGWVQIDIESKYDDRSYCRKLICGACVGLITSSLKVNHD